MQRGVGKRVIIPARDRVLLSIPAKATETGPAQVQAFAVAGDRWDALESDIPVSLSVVPHTFAQYGSTDNSKCISARVQFPSNAITEYGGINVEVNASRMQELRDALSYLRNCRYECTEQISSRLVTNVALKDVRAALDGASIDAKVDASIVKDISTILSRQNPNGSFALWSKGESCFSIFASIFACHALVECTKNGYAVSPGIITRATTWLKTFQTFGDAKMDAATSASLSAYALYVRWLAGQDSVKDARQLLDSNKAVLTLEAIGWLLPIVSGDAKSQDLAHALTQQIHDQIEVTASTASIARRSGYGLNAYQLYYSPIREASVVLNALLFSNAEHPFVSAIVNLLLKSRRSGRWINTQENAYASLALAAYFRKFENVAPDFSAQCWLDSDSLAGVAMCKGYKAECKQFSFPMDKIESKSTNVNLLREGAGRMYYRLAGTYASEEREKAVSRGFTVSREYEPVNDETDVARAPNGEWHIRAGALVRVRVRMRALGDRYHVALVDPLPGGLDSLTPSLAASARDLGDNAYNTWYADERGARIHWWEHQNLRDDRSEAFRSKLDGGIYEFTHFARATTIGRFTAPAAMAEEMYEPETSGCSDSDTLVVE